MNDLNSILIEGNLVREPQYRTTPKGTPLCTFPIATNRFYKQDGGTEKEVSFFNVEAWAKNADICNNHGRKGRGVRIMGRLKQDRWNDNDGKTQSKIVIIVEHVEFRPEFRKSRPAEDETESVENVDAAESLVPTF
jgi:single-strand DNA-binding protein